MTDLLDMQAAAKVLEASVLRLTHIIDVGDLLPSVMPDLTDRDQLWLQSKVEAIRFTKVDIEGFRAELRRRSFEDFRLEYADVLAIEQGPGSRDLEIRRGWEGILRDYCDQLRTMKCGDQPIRLRWCKEKVGCLKLFTDADRFQMSRLQLFWLDRLHEKTRRLSLRVCQECGAAGRLRWGSHATTLCDRHKHLVGSPRAEDGVILDPDRISVGGAGRPFQVLLPGQWSDAELGLNEGVTYDGMRSFALDFAPMIDAGAYIEDDDILIERARRMLTDVDRVIGHDKHVVFKLHRFDQDAVEYRITFEPRGADQVFSVIDEERVERIMREVEEVVEGYRT